MIRGLRFFIAVDISAEQRAACALLLEKLRKGVQFTKAFPKWVDPERMHLTLIFLGNTDTARVEAIARAVEPAVRSCPAFPFHLKGLGVFPHERSPRVLWAGVQEGHKLFCSLQSAVEQALAPLGFQPESRAFHPHLTLARNSSTRDTKAFLNVIHSHRDADLGSGYADHLTLYRSTLTPTGPIYHPLHQWPLSAPKE